MSNRCLKMKGKKVIRHSLVQSAFCLVALVSATWGGRVSAQNVNIKTNTLYWATTTPNLGMEIGTGRKHSLQLFYGLNPWKQGGGNRTSLRHWLVMPEWRYWFCQRFNGWFLGVHGLGGQYNVAGIDLPFGMFPSLDDHRYKGWFVGGGVAAGYQYPLSRHWALEGEIGVGYAWGPYSKYCPECNDKLKGGHRNYVGPTKAAFSVVYFIGGRQTKRKKAIDALPILATGSVSPAMLTAAAADNGKPIAMLANNNIRVTKAKTTYDDGRITVSMQLNLDSLHLRSRQQLVYTPILRNNNGDSLRLPEIVINGRNEQVLYNRGAFAGRFSDGAIAVGRKNGKTQTVDYLVSASVDGKLTDYQLGVQEDLCGCGDIEDNYVYTLYTPEPEEEPMPLLAYITPRVEAEKIRHLDKRAYIDFPVDRTELYPEYRRNPEQLDSIINTINTLKADKNLEVREINIHGYASPESPYTHNDWLARNRAKTLTDYVRRMVDLPQETFSVSSTPEDWEGLRDYLIQSNLPHRDEIMAISNDERLTYDAREWKIKSTYPEEYKYMLKEWYPALRHSDYHITYRVKPFDVAEAKQLIRTKAEQLSLNEMFMVAQTYATGSPEFNEVMETAARMFPNDTTANLNAAIARLTAGDADGAKAYLDKAGNSSEAANAREYYKRLKAKK